LSPVPPVLSGADQARFCPQRSWLSLLFLQRDIGHLSTSFDHRLPVVSAFRSDIKREDYGNFTVVYTAINRCGGSVRIMA
jgi:hypothetical protein